MVHPICSPNSNGLVQHNGSEGAALLLAFYFLKPCYREVLKHEDSQLEVTSLEVRYLVEGTVEDTHEELSNIRLRNFSVMP